MPVSKHSQEKPKPLVHHKLYEENSTKALLEPISPRDFKWDLKGASWITEGHAFYLFGDDGSFCMIQKAYSNLTWPHTSCQISACYHKPASSSAEDLIHKFDIQNFSSLRMKLKDNNTSSTLPTASIELKSGSKDSDFGFELNYSSESSDKQGGLVIKLEFQAQSAPFQIKDGKIYYGSQKKEGFVNTKYIPSGRCTGTISIDGKTFDFKGTGMSIRQFHGIRPHLATNRLSLCYFMEKTSSADKPGRSLFLFRIEASDAYNGQVIHYGYYFDGERVKSVTSTDNQIIHAKSEADPATGFKIPESFEYHWKGVDIDGLDFSASIAGKSMTRMVRIDVLNNVPGLLRKIFEKLSKARPCVYVYYDREIEASINGERLVGNLFQNFSVVLQ